MRPYASSSPIRRVLLAWIGLEALLTLGLPARAQEASPSSAADASPGASPEASAEASAAPEPSPADPATGEAAPPSPKPPEDPFAELNDRIEPKRLKHGSKRIRGPFDRTTKLTDKVKVATTSGPARRAERFLISGLFLGTNLRAVRIWGKRVAEGEYFDEKDGAVTLSRGDAGEFQLKSVTASEVSFEHRGGEIVKRETALRAQAALESPAPSPAPSAAAASPEADASAVASPSDSSSPAAASP